MKRHLTVSIACLRLPFPLFLCCGRSILWAMTNNDRYPNPEPSLSLVKVALDQLEALMIAAARGDRVAMQQRNSARYGVEQLLRQLACFVQIHCGNDLGVLLSSGFVTTRDNKKRIGPLPAPGKVRTTYTGITGEVMLRMKKVHGARSGYTVEIAESADGPWVRYCHCSSSRILVQGLVPTKIYWLRVRANGTAGPGPWSQPVRVIAL
jgi:hypothetical protein